MVNLVEEQKKRILKVLVPKKKFSIARISFMARMNYYTCEHLILELYDEGKIEYVEAGKTKYWGKKGG